MTFYGNISKVIIILPTVEGEKKKRTFHSVKPMERFLSLTVFFFSVQIFRKDLFGFFSIVVLKTKANHVIVNHITSDTVCVCVCAHVKRFSINRDNINHKFNAFEDRNSTMKSKRCHNNRIT